MVLGGFSVGQGKEQRRRIILRQISRIHGNDWPDTDIAHSVPTPTSSTGSMYATEKTVVADVANISEDSYNAYVEKCKKLDMITML